MRAEQLNDIPLRVGSGVGEGAPHCSRALVLRAGSSGRKFLYSSTSFSMDNSWLCSLFRSPGSVSRMWLVSCWGLV